MVLTDFTETQDPCHEAEEASKKPWNNLIPAEPIHFIALLVSREIVFIVFIEQSLRVFLGSVGHILGC